MKIVHYLIAIAICFVSASYGQRQTVMTDTNGNVVFPTNFWANAPVSTNTQEFIGTNAFGETNGFLQFVTRRFDINYLQEVQWSSFPKAASSVTPQGRIWMANSDPITNGSNVSLAVFSNVSNLAQQTNITLTNADAAHGGFRYDPARNVMYASGRFKGGVYGINPTNYSVTTISTNSGAQHRPALIVGDFMYVSKGGAPTAESVSKINLSNDMQVDVVTVAPTNANTSAIYRMETNPAGTILAGSMTGLGSTNNSVFWTIDLETFTPTITSTNNRIFNVIGANDTHAFVTGDPAGAFDLATHSFTEMAGLSYGGILSTNNKVYFFGEGEIVEYNLSNSNKTTYYTGKSGTDRLGGWAEVDGKIIAADGNDNVYELQFTPSVSSQEINISNVVNGASLPFVTNASISNNYTLLNTNRSAIYEITPLDTNRNVLNTSTMEQANQGTFPNGYHFTIRNNSTSNNINFLRFSGSSIATIPPQQSKTWVLVNQSSTTFTNRWKQIYSREEMGLGGGLSTNRTFISYDGTNYTTNSVTISNGIITGWTQ